MSDQTVPDQKTAVESAALRILRLTWGSVNKTSEFSWERLNHSMWTALRLAVGGGFEFKEGDLSVISKDFNAGRWIGETGWESTYAFAIACGNKSAIEVYESWTKRQAIIADNVEVVARGAEHYMHVSHMRRKRERLAVGFKFPWEGEIVTVTSWNVAKLEDGDVGYIIACSYEDRRKEGAQYPDYKIKHRYQIMRDQILNARKAAKVKAK